MADITKPLEGTLTGVNSVKNNFRGSTMCEECSDEVSVVDDNLDVHYESDTFALKYKRFA